MSSKNAQEIFDTFLDVPDDDDVCVVSIQGPINLGFYHGDVEFSGAHIVLDAQSGNVVLEAFGSKEI